MNKRVIEFTGPWKEAFGTPEKSGVWLVWGNSGNGKSSFVMQLCKELAHHGRVIYDSMEEGVGLTMQNTLSRFKMDEVNGRVTILDAIPLDDLSERLLKKKSAEFVIIDSFQYTQLNYKSYLKFKEKHKNKLLIFISHADGKMPSGRSAKSVMFDASQKVWVEGYVAFSKGRFIGKTGQYVVWDKGAEMCWGDKYNVNNNNHETNHSLSTKKQE